MGANMIHEQIQVLKQVLIDYDNAEAKYLEHIAAGSARITDEFRRELLAIPKNTKKQQLTPSHSIQYKKILATVAIIVALLLVLTLSVSAIRETVFEYIEKLYDTYISLSVTSSAAAEENIFIPQTIHYIPSGYTQKDIIQSAVSETQYWVNEVQTIRIYQTSTQTAMSNDIENTEFANTYIGVFEIHYFSKNDAYTLYWDNDTIFFTLNCPVSLGWEEIEKIILNIQPAETSD